MRFLAFLILFCALIISGSHAHGQTVSNTVAANFNFGTFNSLLVNVRNLRITPINPYPGFPWLGTQLPHQPLPNIFQVPSVMSFSVAQNPQMTNGNLIVSNLFIGYPYRITINDLQSSYDYTNYFGVGLAGQSVDASTNQAWLVGPVIFPMGAQGPAGPAGPSGISWGTSTNLIRSATVVLVIPQLPYSQSSYPHGIIYTN